MANQANKIKREIRYMWWKHFRSIPPESKLCIWAHSEFHYHSRFSIICTGRGSFWFTSTVLHSLYIKHNMRNSRAKCVCVSAVLTQSAQMAGEKQLALNSPEFTVTWERYSALWLQLSICISSMSAEGNTILTKGQHWQLALIAWTAHVVGHHI